MKEISNPKLSIITVNYNNLSGLQKTMQSVFDQTYTNREYIIIDGGSMDGSKEIIEKSANKIDYWVSEKDGGIYNAMNKGIKVAKGEYLIFLNSGDLLCNREILDKYIYYVSNYSDVDIFYGDLIGVMDNIDGRWIHKHPSKLSIDFFYKNNLNHQSSLIKFSLFKEFGTYPETYKLAGDHWLYLVCFLNNKKFMHIDDTLVIYDYGGAASIHREKYVYEMNQMWKVLVPCYLQVLVSVKTITSRNYLEYFGFYLKKLRSFYRKYQKLF